MRAKRFICLCAAFLTLGTTGVQAQSLGGLLKKVKKKVAVITGQTQSESQQSAEETAKGKEFPMAVGGTIQNPLAGTVCDIELVGLYGKSTSLNYGVVTPVFKVKMILNKSKINIGSNAVAFDENGNSYKTEYYNVGKEYDVTEGIFVKITPTEGWIFKDVKKTAKTFSVMKMNFWASIEHHATVVFKNVPIQWDVEP